MAVTIPETAVRQIDESQALTESGARVWTESWKDDYATLQALALTIRRGAVYDEAGAVVQSWTLRRSTSGAGILSLSLTAGDELDEDGRQIAKKETWSLKSCRNDVSILAYCGASEGSNPNRYAIEMWMKETDKALADAFSFKDGAAETVALSELSRRVAEKIARGVESVMRFYPQLTCRRVYSAFPAAVQEDLGYIDEPFAPGPHAKAPGNLAEIVSLHQWLKIQDDCDEGQDGDVTRIESWIGILKSAAPDGSPWDQDLYGAGRWQMPLVEKA
jgi:hypothetical protein